MSSVLRRSLLGLLIGLGCIGASTSVAHTASYAVATRHYQLEQWEEAARGFSEVLRSESAAKHHLTARFYLAECRMQLGQYALARDIYLHLLEQPSSHHKARALFRAGEATLLAGGETAGRQLLERFLREYPRDPSAAFALCLLGQLSYENGEFDSAIVFYRRLLDTHPDSSRADSARLELAKTLLSADKPDQVAETIGQAEEYAEAALAAEATLLAGRAQYELGKNSEALLQFQRVFENYPQTATARRARIAAAWALWREEKFAEVANVVEPLSDEPQWLSDYHYLMGMASYGQQQWSDGASQLAQAAALRSDHPSHDAMLFYQGLCYLRQDRQNVARHLFDRVCADYPRSKWATEASRELSLLTPAETPETDRNNSTLPVLDSRIQNGSIASFYDAQPVVSPDGMASQNEKKAKQLLDEAVGLQRDGRYGSAIAVYVELINLESPANLRAEGLRRSAKLHFQLKRYAEAIQLYHQFLREQPDSPHAAEAVADLGWLQVFNADIPIARQRFQELLEKFPQSPQVAEAAYWLASDAADESDSETAGRYLRLALETLTVNKEGSARQQRLLAQSLALRCQLAANDQDWQTIIELMDRSLPSLPDGIDRVRLEYWEAEATFRAKQFSEARERFAKLDARTFGIQESWVAMVPLRRAQLAARRQQWKEVVKFLDRLGREHPDFVLKYEVDYLRGRAEAGRGNFSVARVSYEEVIANHAADSTETSVAAQWMIGETFFHQKNYEYARVAYQAVIDREAPATWQARAALQLGKCWELQHHWEEARAVYSEALKHWPNTEPRDTIEARLNWAESRIRMRR